MGLPAVTSDGEAETKEP